MQNNGIIEKTKNEDEALNRTNTSDNIPTSSSTTLNHFEEARNTSILIKIRHFFKKYLGHILVSVFGLVIGTALLWYAKTLITLKVDYSVIDTKLLNLTTQVDNLCADNVTQELLNIQIEALRVELSSAQNLDRAEIENRINILEQQIAYLQENK